MEQRKLSFFGTLSDAWHKVGGAKASLWGINIAALVVAVLLGLTIGMVFDNAILSAESQMSHLQIPTTGLHSVWFPALAGLVLLFIVAPLLAGAYMVAIKRARGEMVSASNGYGYFNKWLFAGITLFLSVVLNIIITQAINILILRPFLLGYSHSLFMVVSILVSIFFSTLWIFALPLCADKNLNPIQALWQSLKGVAPKWLTVFLLQLSVMLVNIIALLPMIFSLHFHQSGLFHLAGIIVTIVIAVWSFPFSLMIFGTTYHKLFD